MNNFNGIAAHIEPQPFYDAAVAAIRAARSAGKHQLYLAKLHGVSELRPEPKPKEPWVVDLMQEVGRCISENWDVRIIERVESLDRLNFLVDGVGRFNASTRYPVKAIRGAEGLPFLNLLIAGGTTVLLAFDDAVHRLARMGVEVADEAAVRVLTEYWDDLWERCPYWVRRASGLQYGDAGIDALRNFFDKSVRNPAVVAMWFGTLGAKETPDYMTRVFREFIAPAIAQAGFKAERVDFVPHNDLIMQQVFRMIRSAPFVVAGFTGNRNGVYYEAGFARALGLPVIHCCRRGDFEQAHFEIQQLQTLVWDEPDDLTSQLPPRILALCGRGPYV